MQTISIFQRSILQTFLFQIKADIKLLSSLKTDLVKKILNFPNIYEKHGNFVIITELTGPTREMGKVDQRVKFSLVQSIPGFNH